MTALLLASENGHYSVVELLLCCGVNRDHTNTVRYTWPSRFVMKYTYQ